MQPNRRPIVNQPWLRLLILAVFLCIILFVGRTIDLRRAMTILKDANWQYFAVAFLINLTINNSAKAAKFIFILNRSLRVPKKIFWHLSLVTLATRAANNILTRAGETYRVPYLRKYGYSSQQIIAAVLVEPAIEALALFLPAIPLMALLPFVSTIKKGVLLVGAFAAAALIVMVLIRIFERQSAHTKKPKTWLDQQISALSSLGTFPVWSKALLLSWISDVTDFFMIGLCLHAVGISISPAYWYLILVSVNVAIAPPISLANFGTLEAGAIIVLNLLGTDRSQALAFAFLYHLSHLLPIMLTGSISLALELLIK